MSSSTISKLIRVKYIFALVISFFIFELYLFLRSFPAEYNIFLRYQTRMQTNDPFWTSFWFGSELTGEVGLIFRFVGVCFLLAFSLILVWRGQAIFSYLKRAILLEGVYYLFMIPFILSLYLRPDTTFVNIEAGLSYTMQIIFISPAFLMLYLTLRKAPIDRAQMFRWGAVAIVGYTFALWIKHFLLMLYALPFNLANPILVVGSLNATSTILAAGLILTVTFLPMIRRQRLSFNPRLAGVGFLLIGLHFVIYISMSLLIQRYWDFMMLTELWALAFIILSVGYISKR
jgi:hypothetical protein